VSSLSRLALVENFNRSHVALRQKRVFVWDSSDFGRNFQPKPRGIMKRPVSSLSHVTSGERLQFDLEAFFLGKALNDLFQIPNLNHSTLYTIVGATRLIVHFLLSSFCFCCRPWWGKMRAAWHIAEYMLPQQRRLAPSALTLYFASFLSQNKVRGKAWLLHVSFGALWLPGNGIPLPSALEEPPLMGNP
jgi:hypothetical protein